MVGNPPPVAIWAVNVAVVTRVPAVTELDQDPLSVIETGDWVKVDGDRGVVEITKKCGV